VVLAQNSSHISEVGETVIEGEDDQSVRQR
jgi:hypothetical protein